MKKPKNNVNELLAAIKRQAPEGPAAVIPISDSLPAHETVEKEELLGKKREKASTPTPAKKTKSKIGRAVQYWMHDADTQLVRELYAWLAGQGIRPTDSLVVRAALRYAKTGSQFLEAYRQASQLDGRLKRD
jgi:hypothetical protein